MIMVQFQNRSNGDSTSGALAGMIVETLQVYGRIARAKSGHRRNFA